MPDTDWNIAEGLDPDGPSAADLDRFGDEMIECRHCGSKIYDQSEICPRCGHAQEAAEKKLPLWTIGIAILMIGLLLVWVM